MARKNTSKRATSNHGKTLKRTPRGSGKVGSDPESLREIGGKLDFGAPESDVRQRDYVSHETKHSDPGAEQMRFKTDDGTRVSGAGSNASGPGSGSGGDLDTDIVGVGFGGSGIAQSGPDQDAHGPDTTTRGGSEPFAAPGPKGHRATKSTKQQPIEGTTFDRSGGDLSTTGGGLGSGSVSNPMARNDDSFAADIQEDEARGGDNSDSDNQ